MMELDRSTRARLTTGIVLLMVLGAGGVLGVALDRQLRAGDVALEQAGRPEGRSGMDGRGRVYDPRSRDPARDSAGGRGSSPRGGTMIVDRVGLSETQKAKVDSIVGYYRGQMRALHEEFDEAYSTRYRDLNRMVREEVRAVLTDAQRTTYDSLQAVWTQRRQERQLDSISGGGDGRSGTGGQRNQP